MADKAAAVVLASATGVMSYSWLTTANDLATFAVTIMAFLGALGAALYHFERWRKLRKERKENE